MDKNWATQGMQEVCGVEALPYWAATWWLS